jgi:hypothetical protein
MIRALFLAFVAAFAIQSGAPTTEAGNQQLSVEQQCSAQGVTAFFSWTGVSPDATEQWVDLSLHHNGWQGGTYLGWGPLAPSTTALTWDGLVPNAIHYVRTNQQLPNGAWDSSATFYFQTMDCAGGGGSAAAASSEPSSTSRSLFDMSGRHDGTPLGVPGNFSWQAGPEIQAARPPAGWNAMLAWGQVYPDANQPRPPANLRIQVAGVTVYGLVGGTWTVLQESHRFGGGHFSPTYSGGAIRAITRPESTGGISVLPHPGRPYHFYPSSRVVIPAGLTGVVVAVQARLILDDPNGPDTRPQAKLMLGAGLDWFGGLAGNTKTRGACVGRMTWLTSEFQTFVCHTFSSPGVLEANPPPLP